MEISISKQQLASLPAAQFQGTIKVVDDPGMVDYAIERLRKSDLIGFDTETRPSFKKGQSYKVALLQLSSNDECFLFRLNKIGMPEPLKQLLEDKNAQKVGLSIHDDFRNLHKSYDFEPQGFIELQQFATQWNIIDKSLSKLFGILFGKRLSKSQRLSNWEADQLAEAQQHYAALDAQACVKIYKYLNAGLFHPEESEYIIQPTEEEI
ncbi:MAG: 3'-5' exonuclease domain-containing protein 2 [Muribaculaceae bacterium]|nr:3'-5' exonuclease domain-containing protein 2 [Muribaculaceae bacterium]MDE6523512.1 3'-5' exonuclease domain-containing protein 2 [Muribaculaceae bacterium]MDE6786169.1 3'-5' exonuclease domain-containing protein 2 [Muribaculaceae bacterium]